MEKVMKMAALLSMLASVPAVAMDCAKAASALDKRICSDHTLKAADDAMSAAYFKLLASIKDPEIHASLIESQRRWIKEREKSLGDLSGYVDGNDDPLSRDQQRAILLDATHSRTAYLSDHSGEQSDFVVTALKQRQLARSYSGGPYAGYTDTSCYFIPDQRDQSHWTYNCFGTRTYQNGNRICSENNDFASYRTETARDVAIIENGKWKPVAHFSGSEWKWTRSSEPASELSASDVAVLKVDPDALFDNDDDKGWMHACLTDPSFPFDGTQSN
jgi:uncharacterized protein YecT (DUF1311 family)